MRVLFVCVANNNRSQIAEAIFNRLTKNNVARSAGIRPHGSGVMLREGKQHNPTKPMMELGYDLSGAKIKRVTPAMVSWADKVVVLFVKDRWWDEAPAYLKKHKNKEFWNIHSLGRDVSGEEYRRFERKRILKIKRLVKNLVERIG